MSVAVHVAVLAVTHLEHACRFYGEGLGFRELTRAAPGEGRTWIEMETGPGSARIALVNADGWGMRPQPGPVLTLSCEDLPSVLETLGAAGAEPSAAADTPWGLSSQVRDPDGQLIILGQRR